MDDVYKEISPRLKALRDAVGMSVEELAEKTGTSVADVARYETGEHEIPVSFLFAAAKACGVDTTVLISGGDPHLRSYTVVRKGEGLSVDRRKTYDYKSLAYRFAGRKMEPFLVTVPPKDVKALDFNSHSGQEFIYVVEGRLEIHMGDTPVALEPGDGMYFDSHTPHALRGLDGKPAKFVDVII
ncbi:transcriptional regulator, XRE family [Desulfovibrio sp. X2]|uniref:helix-turn-helix domain-containing protein n=1 Tax=Desulfovibrio sp. X2 TaxID=941449 RepID=UPI000358C7CB|nr:XRE family transcriptional regulator [Desulfovibrio sp. X2]EPR44562.1 transcriptional regulator, XRE family [Desulfovibrio sp. X2]